MWIRQVIYHWKEECLNFIQKQTYANHAHEYQCSWWQKMNFSLFRIKNKIPICQFFDLNRNGLYDGQKYFFSSIIFGTVFCIPFNLSQQEMTKFSVWGPRKKCAVPSCDTIPSFCDESGFESKIHQRPPFLAYCYDFIV